MYKNVYYVKKKDRKLDIKQKIKRLEKVQKEISIDHNIKLLKSKRKDLILIIKNQYNGIIYVKTVKETQNTRKV